MRTRFDKLFHHTLAHLTDAGFDPSEQWENTFDHPILGWSAFVEKGRDGIYITVAHDGWSNYARGKYPRKHGPFHTTVLVNEFTDELVEKVQEAMNEAVAA